MMVASGDVEETLDVSRERDVVFLRSQRIELLAGETRSGRGDGGIGASRLSTSMGSVSLVREGVGGKKTHLQPGDVILKMRATVSSKTTAAEGVVGATRTGGSSGDGAMGAAEEGHGRAGGGEEEKVNQGKGRKRRGQQAYIVVRREDVSGRRRERGGISVELLEYRRHLCPPSSVIERSQASQLE
jgi:hypothetical protein